MTSNGKRRGGEKIRATKREKSGMTIGRRVGSRVLVSYTEDGESRWVCDGCGASVTMSGAPGICRRCRDSEGERVKRTGVAAGMIFGEWMVIRVSMLTQQDIFWTCRCSCGQEKQVSSRSLRIGKTTRCRSCSNAAKAQASGLRRASALGITFGTKTLIGRERHRGRVWRCCVCGGVSVSGLAKPPACVACYRIKKSQMIVAGVTLTGQDVARLAQAWGIRVRSARNRLRLNAARTAT